MMLSCLRIFFLNFDVAKLLILGGRRFYDKGGCLFQKIGKK